MTPLKQEFTLLQKRYNLHQLKYMALKPCKSIYFNNNPYLNAAYLHTFDYVVMRNGDLSPGKLKSMLHEMCHAIQYKENRLIVPRHHYKKIYALELEAELFAHSEYNKLYASKYGVLENWDLAEYSFYKKYMHKPPQEVNDICYAMSGWDLYNFIFGLKGKYKKHIVDIIQKSDHNASWMKILKCICI